jgi:hypothetical protein
MYVESDLTDPSVPRQGVGTAAPSAVAHTTELVEKGSFTTARCGCGWSAPARRSRDKSRRDAAQHLEQAEHAGRPEHADQP